MSSRSREYTVRTDFANLCDEPMGILGLGMPFVKEIKKYADLWRHFMESSHWNDCQE
jgi:hypothetical protein